MLQDSKDIAEESGDEDLVRYYEKEIESIKRSKEDKEDILKKQKG